MRLKSTRSGIDYFNNKTTYKPDVDIINALIFTNLIDNNRDTNLLQFF